MSARPKWMARHQQLGEIARLEGDLPAARAHLREALRVGALNSDNTDIVR